MIGTDRTGNGFHPLAGQDSRLSPPDTFLLAHEGRRKQGPEARRRLSPGGVLAKHGWPVPAAEPHPNLGTEANMLVKAL